MGVFAEVEPLPAGPGIGVEVGVFEVEPLPDGPKIGVVAGEGET